LLRLFGCKAALNALFGHGECFPRTQCGRLYWRLVEESIIASFRYRSARGGAAPGTVIRLSGISRLNSNPEADLRLGTSMPAGGRQHRRSASGRAAHSLDVTNFGRADQGRYDGVLLSIVEKVQSVERLSGTSFVCRETDKEFFRIVARRFYSLTRGFIIPLIGPSEERSPSVLCTPSRPVNSHVAWSKAVLRLLVASARISRQDIRYFLADVNANNGKRA
jgi:hypothetical protein